MAVKKVSSLDEKKQEKKKSFNCVNFLPEEYKIIDIISKGNHIIINMEELMEVKNTENRAEIISVMNKASTNYFFFSRMEIDLEDLLIAEKEKFDLWVAQETSKFKDESSEKAKDRRLMAEKGKEYTEKKMYIGTLEGYMKQAEIAKRSLEKSITMLQSIGAMTRTNIQQPASEDL